MHLKKLKITDYKNIRELSLELSPKVNCFVGNNGTGKTNLLDSVYFLSFTKSYFSSLDAHLIRKGEQFGIVEGVYDRNGDTDTVVISIRQGAKKTVKRNGKLTERMSDHVGLYPVVIISPADSDIIQEGSASRRKFIDSVISQIDRSFLQQLMRYNKTIEQRNSLLRHYWETRTVNSDQLDVYDQMLIGLGEAVYSRRREFIDQFIVTFSEMYARITGEAEQVGIEYKSDFSDGNTVEKIRDARDRDMALNYTTVGAHRDDLLFTIDSMPVKKFGSQGQQKSFLTALKFAQFEYMKKKSGVAPILLLDDIFDKLDASRVEHIMRLVSGEMFGQIFISDTHPGRIRELVEMLPADYRIFDTNDLKAGNSLV